MKNPKSFSNFWQNLWPQQTSPPIVSDTNLSNDRVLIDLRQVVKTFETPAGSFTALRNVNLQVNAGEFAAVIGKSGSGKSTLINMITGIDRPTLGEVYVGQRPIHNLNEDQMALWRGRNLGVIFQFFQLLPTLTLIENVMLPMELGGTYTRSERQERALHLLDSVGLADQAFKFPAAVSGGQQQRVAIARALANDPDILVADEPTGSLDSKTADSIFMLFEDFVRQGRTILMVTHDRDLASRVSRVILIADGEITDQQISTALPSLNKEEQVKLLSRLEPITYEAGQAIIEQGQSADHFYILTKGTLEVILTHPNGDEIVVGYLKAGQYFGEMGLLEGGVRTATVRVPPSGDAMVMQLDRETFISLTQNSKLTNQEIAHLIRQRTLSKSLGQLGAHHQELSELDLAYDVLTFAPEEIILRPGDPAEQFFIISKGQVEIVQADESGQNKVIATLGSGEYFGEMGVLEGRTRNSLVRAAQNSDVELLAISGENFKELVQKSSTVEQELALIIAERRLESLYLDQMMDQPQA